MKLIIKLFPEITIKSKAVRWRFITILTQNIRNIIKQCDKSVVVVRHWDNIELRTSQEQLRKQVIDALTRIPGIHHILAVEERFYQNIHDIYEQTLMMNRNRLVGKSFCVRVKRRGQHSFTSQDIERYVGRGLNQNVANTSVKLTNPEETVCLEINQNRLFMITNRYEGIGGFPLGTQEDVLSLISGGFDSSVSSYMLMRRGYLVHYCFFNIGGIGHENGVLQIAHYLWSRFASTHKVRFVSINFTNVVNKIAEQLTNSSYMGIVLKRMMVRAASAIAKRYWIPALVTGEVLAQVSSQTLTNLQLIDEISERMIIRPLISYDKEQIINLARQIGTEKFAKHIPEYCGLIAPKATVRAVRQQLEQEEINYDYSVLDEAIAQANIFTINDIIRFHYDPQNIQFVDITTTFRRSDVVLDIRLPDEQADKPLLWLKNVPVQSIPFYQLSHKFKTLDQSKSYILYCQNGIMSQQQALYLQQQGFTNVKVYRPPKHK